MSYLPHASVRPLSDYIKVIMSLLEPHKDEFEVIYVRGLSGIVPGAIVAHLLGKRLSVLRKDKEYSHGTLQEGEVCGAPYVIIDDFVSSGDTMRTLISRQVPHLPTFVLLYGDSRPTIKLPSVRGETGYVDMMKVESTIHWSCSLYTVHWAER